MGIGFGELLVIALVALVVVGPEDLPRFAVKIGRLMGQMKGSYAKAKEELEKEISIEDTNLGGDRK